MTYDAIGHFFRRTDLRNYARIVSPIQGPHVARQHVWVEGGVILRGHTATPHPKGSYSVPPNVSGPLLTPVL